MMKIRLLLVSLSLIGRQFGTMFVRTKTYAPIVWPYRYLLILLILSVIPDNVDIALLHPLEKSSLFMYL